MGLTIFLWRKDLKDRESKENEMRTLEIEDFPAAVSFRWNDTRNRFWQFYSAIEAVDQNLSSEYIKYIGEILWGSLQTLEYDILSHINAHCSLLLPFNAP
jgi:hypothetical protein